jgi:hypothetical protein
VHHFVKRIMKFKSPFHKNITIIAMSMMAGMIFMSFGAVIYDLHLQGGNFSWADLSKLISFDQVNEVKSIIESVIVKLTQTIFEFLRSLLKG